jgi:large subunit ribosomal protein L10
VDNPRPEKVAVVEEVKDRLANADAALLTEYRGLDVAAMAELRRALRAAGGEMTIYKNSLVRFAAHDLGLDLDDLLTGPTAIAFVPAGTDGATADPVPVAKALRDFGRTHPALVVKGGVMGTAALSAADAAALAEVAPREELLARFAGLLAAPMQQLAGLLQALPRDLAYGLRALIDQGGAPGAPTAEADTAEAPADTAEAPAAEAPADTAEAETTPETTPEASVEADTDPTEES